MLSKDPIQSPTSTLCIDLHNFIRELVTIWTGTTLNIQQNHSNNSCNRCNNTTRVSSSSNQYRDNLQGHVQCLTSLAFLPHHPITTHTSLQGLEWRTIIWMQEQAHTHHNQQQGTLTFVKTCLECCSTCTCTILVGVNFMCGLLILTAFILFPSSQSWFYIRLLYSQHALRLPVPTTEWPQWQTQWCHFSTGDKW